ncbi:MAG TPA: GvpL/GvpF family gas vesicle protein [Solirubrobacteraceae bacterium]|jgi:hypothetical protein
MATAEERWRRLVEDLAQADAPDVVKEARAGARGRVRTALEDALVDELMRAVRGPNAAGTADRAEPVPTEPPEDLGDAHWVYCVVPAERAPELAAGLSGVESASPVVAVVEGELAALLSRVPLSQYGDEQLRRHLEDIAWLERTARAHEAVQEGAMRNGPLVPLRMCTIYRELAGVRRMLRDRAELFAENLAAVEDCAEWGVKVFVDLRRIPASSPAEPEPTNSSGADYLAGRQRERDRVSEADELCLRCAEEVHQAVSVMARQDRVNPVQRAEAHGRDAEMVLNEAYLLQDSRIEELRSTVEELAERWAPDGLLVELTGPWPPYNFVSESAGLIS